jgi:hypothetical protein
MKLWGSSNVPKSREDVYTLVKNIQRLMWYLGLF